MSSLPIRIVGAPGSPCSRKMRALVRYRRIPHRFIVRNSRADRDLPPVPVALIPIVIVGSNEETAPVIEESYRQLLRVLDAHLSSRPFVMGERPGTSDFALYGQLTQLAQFDPTPAAVALERAPNVVAWVDLVECVIDGRDWTQPPFPYQRKCLGWLRESRARLAAADRRRVDDLLSGTGCEPLFSD